MIINEIKYCLLDEWRGNSLSEIYSYLNDGCAKIYSDCINIKLTSNNERKTFLTNTIYIC